METRTQQRQPTRYARRGREHVRRTHKKYVVGKVYLHRPSTVQGMRVLSPIYYSLTEMTFKIVFVVKFIAFLCQAN